jgi:hypothetical protein
MEVWTDEGTDVCGCVSIKLRRFWRLVVWRYGGEEVWYEGLKVWSYGSIGVRWYESMEA